MHNNSVAYLKPRNRMTLHWVVRTLHKRTTLFLLQCHNLLWNVYCIGVWYVSGVWYVTGLLSGIWYVTGLLSGVWYVTGLLSGVWYVAGLLWCHSFCCETNLEWTI